MNNKILLFTLLLITIFAFVSLPFQFNKVNKANASGGCSWNIYPQPSPGTATYTVTLTNNTGYTGESLITNFYDGGSLISNVSGDAIQMAGGDSSWNWSTSQGYGVNGNSSTGVSNGSTVSYLVTLTLQNGISGIDTDLNTGQEYTGNVVCTGHVDASNITYNPPPSIPPIPTATPQPTITPEPNNCSYNIYPQPAPGTNTYTVTVTNNSGYTGETINNNFYDGGTLMSNVPGDNIQSEGGAPYWSWGSELGYNANGSSLVGLPNGSNVSYLVNLTLQNGVSGIDTDLNTGESDSGATLCTGHVDASDFTYNPPPSPTLTPTPTPTTTTLTPIADSFIQHNEQNSNEGASPFLELSVEGKERALIQFNKSQIQAAVGNDPNYTATLQLTIVSNNNKWSTGRQIDVDRMEQAWTEGNGSYNYNNNRGTGSGVTWDCATDTNITNQSDNCSGSTVWDMIDQGSWPFDGTPTATTIITNNQSGTISFNVTSDVQSFLSGANPNYGWIVKKDDETADGDIQFGSKESSYIPKLIITLH